MLHDQGTLGPKKMTISVGKWHNHRTPADGPPDETVEQSFWQDTDGSVITDAARLAALEAHIARGSED